MIDSVEEKHSLSSLSFMLLVMYVRLVNLDWRLVGDCISRWCWANSGWTNHICEFSLSSMNGADASHSVILDYKCYSKSSSQTWPISNGGTSHLQPSISGLMTRGLVTGLISAPFIINNFIAAEIAQAVLPNWWAEFLILVNKLISGDGDMLWLAQPLFLKRRCSW